MRALMGEGFGRLYPEGSAGGGVYTFPGGLSAAALALGKAIDTAGTGRLLTSAAVYRIKQDREGVNVSYLRGNHAYTLRGRTVIIAAPKFIARHLVADLPHDQSAAMARMHYVPYLVGAVCVDGILSRDLVSASVIDAPVVSFSDVSTSADRQLFRIEIPMTAADRAQLLDENWCLKLADEIADYFARIFPGAGKKIEEIRIWRRGHNWYLPVPGMVTEFQRAAARSFGRIHFANADSLGVVSDFGWAMLSAERAATAALRVLEGGPA